MSRDEPVRWPPPCAWVRAAAIGYDALLATTEPGRVNVRFRMPDGGTLGGTMAASAMTPEAVMDLVRRFEARCGAG